MKNLNKEIKVTANQSAKTFTISIFNEGVLISKYRTHPMSKLEFEDCECNTQSDWNEFLKSDSYYKV
jgi:hypothetical protein